MKRFMFTCGLCTMAGVLLLGADTPDPNKAKPAETATKSVTVSAPAPSAEPAPAPVTPPAPAAETAQQPKNDTATPKAVVPATSNASSTEKPSLKFNFRDVPLDTVLDYLSEAGGFTVVREAAVEGRVDIVSLQPLSKDEAVALLNTVLNGRGFAAIRNEKTLTIVKSEDAKQKDIPVRSGNDPNNVPKTGEMVTQVIPVRHADVTQLLENLKPLLPTYAVANANASSNAIVLTDTQTDVRRMIEIIKALDTSISAISDVKVFPLTYADAVDAASMINTLFQTTTSGQSGNNNMRNFFRNMRNASSGGGTSSGGGGGAPGGMMGGPGGMPGGPGGMMGGPGGMMGGPGGMMGGSTGSDSAAIQAGSRVQAVGDDRTNSVIVTASSDTLPLIENVLHQIDIEGVPAAPMRVFPLNYADATEMAEVINDAFGQNAVGATNRQKTSTQTSSRSGGQARSSSSSTILAYAVADYRTNSVVVTAEDDVMEQVVHMVEKLETNPAREQKVFIYKLKNADVENVAEVLEGMFSTSSSSSSAKKSSSSSSKSSSSSTKSSSSSSNRSSSSSSF